MFLVCSSVNLVRDGMFLQEIYLIDFLVDFPCFLSSRQEIAAVPEAARTPFFEAYTFTEF